MGTSISSRPSPGTLFVVALPLGNPGDITIRAIETLKKTDVIAAEDTRTFRQIMSRANIDLGETRILAHHAHNEKSSAHGLVELLLEGKSIALTTDAGTPGVSDPGLSLIKACLEKNIPVKPMPGASSLTAALSVCPFGATLTTFAGFPPASKGARKKLFERLKNLDGTAVLFEGPHRLAAHLEDAKEIFGDIRVFVAREMTKTYEEYFLGTISEALEHFQEPKGEFVVTYEIPAGAGAALTSEEDLRKSVERLLAEGLSTKEVLNALLTAGPKSALPPKKDLYTFILKIRNK